MPFGQEGLVISLVGPVPKVARVAFTNGDIFSAVARVTGPEIPKDFPKKYTKDLQKVEIFNASMAWDIEELVRWEKRHGIEAEKDVVAIFENYLKTGHAIRMMLVEHPKVPDPGLYKNCSVVLQRGVIIHANGRETLFLRSYARSAKDSENFVNFVPRGGIQMSFASETIWFPLELTQVIQEPASHVVLDILTPKPLDVKDIPIPFRREKTGQMKYRGETYNVARVTARLVGKQMWPDLRLKP